MAKKERLSAGQAGALDAKWTTFQSVKAEQGAVTLTLQSFQSSGTMEIKSGKSPIRSFTGHLVASDSLTELDVWIQDERFQGWRGLVAKGAGLPVNVGFKDAGELSIRIAPKRKSNVAVSLLEGEITLADGSRVALAQVVAAGLAKDKLTQKNVEPETRAFDKQAARALLTLDWMRQKGALPWGEACEDQSRRIERILNRREEAVGDSGCLAWRERVDALRLELASAGGAADEKLYFQFRDLKRKILFSSPDVDFNEILCVDNNYSADGYDHETRYRNGDNAAMGGRLLVLSGLGPDATPRKLAPKGEMAGFCRPDLRFDAKEVVFSMKTQSDRAYHLYTVGIDGSGLKRLTESDYDDLDPLYLPGGSFAFNTTRCNQFLRCSGSVMRMAIMARCDRDGRNIYFISANIEADYSPALTPEGQLLYCRWEYVDKEVLRVQSLWTVNPDGTGLAAYWGNQSRWPDMLHFPRIIPGTRDTLCAAVAHHDVFKGGLCVIKPQEGLNYPDGVYNLTPHIPWPEAGKGPMDRPLNSDFQAPACYSSFWSPYPVSRDLMLVSARPCRPGKEEGFMDESKVAKFNLYLMDYDGNMELLYQGAQNILYAQPVRTRSKPPEIPSRVAWPGRKHSADHEPKPGLFYSGDVYEGSGISPGMVARLRIMEIEPKYWGDGNWSKAARNLIPKNAGISVAHFGGTIVSLLYDESTKLVLGTVPVEADSSVYFEAPPGRALYFQLLDKQGRCLQTMRTSVHLMPGEVRGCVGCHETRAVAPAVKKAMALRRPPNVLDPPQWKDESINFKRFVQATLDAHCIKCHNPGKSSGGYDFTGRPLDHTPFTASYVALVFGLTGPDRKKQGVEGSPAGPIFPYVQYDSKVFKISTLDTVVPPMKAMSYRSRLMEIVSSGEHHGVNVSPEERARIVAWIDALCPMIGRDELIEMPDDGGEPKAGQTYGARLRTHPQVFKAFAQDEFKTQSDRIPKDENGQDLPPYVLKDGKRLYSLPRSKNE